jgi:hypothetical protein
MMLFVQKGPFWLVHLISEIFQYECMLACFQSIPVFPVYVVLSFISVMAKKVLFLVSSYAMLHIYVLEGGLKVEMMVMMIG